MAGAPVGRQTGLHGIDKREPSNGSDFASHADVAPQIRPVGEAFVIDFNDEIGHDAGERIAWIERGIEFQARRRDRG